MQHLTVSASVPKRKQACKSCRQRKRGCDAKRPACSLCRKWGIACEYGAIASYNSKHTEQQVPVVLECPSSTSRNHIDSLFDHSAASARDPNQPLNDEHFHILSPSFLQQPPLQLSYPTPDWGLDSFPSDPESLAPAPLPPNETLRELFEIFFTELYHCFPCFHKASILAEIQCGQLQIDSPLLCYAICTIAARFHPDPTVKSRQNKWYDEAKLLYEFSSRDLPNAVRTIQAVLCLDFHAFTTGDFSSCWLFLGKAWRQITAIGMNRLDSFPPKASHADKDSNGEETIDFCRRAWNEISAISREECRRTLWLLFMQDRAQSWPTGWAPAIPESHFKVNLPMPESIFQSMTPSTPLSETHNIPFDQDFDALLVSLPSGKQPPNLLLYLFTAYILLGRAAEYIHSPHADPTSLTYRAHCSTLETYLVKLRLRLPRSASSIPEAAPADRPLVVWLDTILHTISILLHYRLAGLPSAASAGAVDARAPTNPDPYTLALAAAKSTSLAIHTTSQISTALLLNPFIASALFLAASVLIIHMRLAEDTSCAPDIELFQLVFARMGDVYAVVGAKFQVAMERYLGWEKEALVKLQEECWKGLVADCSGWRAVEQELKRRGLTIR